MYKYSYYYYVNKTKCIGYMNVKPWDDWTYSASAFSLLPSCWLSFSNYFRILWIVLEVAMLEMVHVVLLLFLSFLFVIFLLVIILVEKLETERLVRSRLQWAGHVERMADDRLPKRAAELCEQGRRRRGRPSLRWEDCVKRDVRKAGEEEDWKTKTRDRGGWKRLSDEAVKKLRAAPHPWQRETRKRERKTCLIFLLIFLKSHGYTD